MKRLICLLLALALLSGCAPAVPSSPEPAEPSEPPAAAETQDSRTPARPAEASGPAETSEPAESTEPAAQYDAADPRRGTVQSAEDGFAVVLPDGRLVVWGAGLPGSDGPTDFAGRYVLLEGVEAVYAADAICGALGTDGTLYLWDGALEQYQAAGGETAPADGQPEIRKTLTGVRTASLGTHWGAAILDDGGLVLWGGVDYDGQGQPMVTAPARRLEDVTAVSCGLASVFAVTADGVLWELTADGETRLGQGFADAAPAGEWWNHQFLTDDGRLLTFQPEPQYGISRASGPDGLPLWTEAAADVRQLTDGGFIGGDGAFRCWRGDEAVVLAEDVADAGAPGVGRVLTALTDGTLLAARYAGGSPWDAWTLEQAALP